MSSQIQRAPSRNKRRSPLIGAHMSIAGGKCRAINRALEQGCTGLQIFVKNASQWRAKPQDQEEASEFRKQRLRSILKSVVAHDSYLINLASPDPGLWRKSIDALVDEMQRCEALGLDYLVVHPGAHVGQGETAGIRRIAKAIDQVTEQVDGYRVRIALETTAGQGTHLGYRFEHFRDILGAVRHPDRVFLCFDTCHVFAAGYDLRTRADCEQVFSQFEKKIGLARLRIFHFNDSRKPLGSRIDRHQHIGQGEIGETPFEYILNQRRFEDIPKLLETPKNKEGSLDRMNLDRLQGLVRH